MQSPKERKKSSYVNLFMAFHGNGNAGIEDY